MSNLRFPLVLISLFTSILVVKAQENNVGNERKRLELKGDIQIGMIAGGQILNQEFVYESGFIAQASVNTPLSPFVSIGLGAGIQALETETIIPFFLDLKAHFREGGNAPFIGVNIGSSAGWSKYYRNLPNYEYEGGFYFSPYYSFQFPVSEKTNVLFAIGYIHQIAEIEYITEFEDEYEERFSLDFLTIRTGIKF